MSDQDLEKTLTENILLRNFEMDPGNGIPSVLQKLERGEVDDRLIVFHKPRSIESEYFRFLKHRIERKTDAKEKDEDKDKDKDEDKGEAILITGPNLGVGKTTCALNLALVFARSYGEKILLMDADSRRGTTREYLGIKDTRLPGLVDVLTMKEKAEKVLVNTGLFDMTYFPSGEFNEAFLDVLKGRELAHLIQDLKKRFRYIIIDSPPAFPMPETTVFAQHCDGVFIVLRAGRDGPEDLEQAKEALQEANVLGVILNGVKPTLGQRYGSRGYYGYYGKHSGNGR